MSEAEQQAKTVLDRLSPDPTTPNTTLDAACRILFFGVEAAVDALIDGIESDNRDVAISDIFQGLSDKKPPRYPTFWRIGPNRGQNAETRFVISP